VNAVQGPSVAPGVLEIDDLHVSVGGVPILRGVSLQVANGTSLGIVGESGSGKSMTLRAVTRLLPKNATVSGRVTVSGRDVLAMDAAALRRHRRSVGMVFQDPRSAVNPIHPVGSFLLERAKDSNADLRAARERAVATLRRMRISDPEARMAQYPFELSGGLLQRVMIASVLMERPALLLADEPTTALDVTTQADVLALTDELRRESGTAMIFVSHDLDLATAICDRIAVMYGGQVLEEGPAAEIASTPKHPYTRALLASRPDLDRRLPEIRVIDGAPRAASDTGPGCPFASRCPVALDRCAQLPPPATAGDHSVRCHRIAEVDAGILDAELPLRVVAS
jgi:oligopeptide/dipeptide ABC transporter ATP-binding protein